ncbi:MAG: aminotransferase class IV family protein [Anaerolineales bacterium]|nr:aminotransferase class IV family protein [Anaerolineales bacterium]
MTIIAYEVTADGLMQRDDAPASLDGLTAQLSDGFYTTFSSLAQGTKVLGLRAHLHRLYGPAKERHLRPPVGEAELRKRIAELIQVNLPYESRVRLILTKDTGRLYIGIQPFTPLPEAVYANGVQAISAELARTDPTIKDSGFISQSAKQRKLLSKDVFEILLTKDGKILEGMTSNFYVVVPQNSFCVKEAQNEFCGTVVTAQRGILLGVTRRVVLRIARGQGMKVEYRAPSLSESFAEAFLTSSSRGVVPIVSIDNQPVGQGRVGRTTKMLMQAYADFVTEHAEQIAEG